MGCEDPQDRLLIFELQSPAKVSLNAFLGDRSDADTDFLYHGRSGRNFRRTRASKCLSKDFKVVKRGGEMAKPQLFLLEGISVVGCRKER